MHHLIFGLNGSVIISRAWLYKETNASVLQVNVKLVQNGECWTWNQTLIGGLGSILTGVTFCHWNILFSHSKDFDANIGIIAILVHFEKNSIEDTLLWHCLIHSLLLMNYSSTQTKWGNVDNFGLHNLKTFLYITINIHLVSFLFSQIDHSRNPQTSR